MSLADFSLADQQHYLMVWSKAASFVSCIETVLHSFMYGVRLGW